jgi:uncharacterized DUF497 family protein
VHLVYDPSKNAINLRKHGVDLEDAKLVLFDPRALVREDTDAEGEQRFIIVGTDARSRVLTVIYTYREPDTIRLISARPATKRERQAYEA